MQTRQPIYNKENHIEFLQNKIIEFLQNKIKDLETQIRIKDFKIQQLKQYINDLEVKTFDKDFKFKQDQRSNLNKKLTDVIKNDN